MYCENGVSEYGVFDRDHNHLFDIKYVKYESISYSGDNVDINITNAFMNEEYKNYLSKKGIYLLKTSHGKDLDTGEDVAIEHLYYFDHFDITINGSPWELTEYVFYFYNGCEIS